MHGCKGWGDARMQEVGCCTDARGGGERRKSTVVWSHHLENCGTGTLQAQIFSHLRRMVLNSLKM